MPRGSGDHQPSLFWSAVTSIGKMPRRYALTSVAGSRSPPTAIRSLSGHRSGDGNAHRLSPTGCGVVDQSVTGADDSADAPGHERTATSSPRRNFRLLGLRHETV